MPEGRKFSHISVNAAEDDDIVIEAGAYAKPVAEPASKPNPAPSQARASQYEPEPELEAEASPEAVPAQVSDSEPQEAPDEKAAAKAHASVAPRDTYDQTLEDLERTPMSSMQRNVLIGLAIVVIASCIYYVVRFVL